MKTMRKVGAVVLALCLCLSLCVTAFAASSSDEDVDFTITVTNAADGETYTAYKIFDVTYTYDDDAENGQYAYSITEDNAWYSIVAADTSPFTLTLAVDGSYIVSVKADATEDEIISFFVDAGVPENAVAAVSVEASNGTAVLNVTDPGYYYVTTTLGSLVIIDTTNPAVAIDDKNGQPTVEKYVHDNGKTGDDYWGKEDDADNDSDVLFEIVISNINGAENLVLHDSMDDELSIPDVNNFHLSTMTLYTSEGEEGVTLVEGTDYTITIGECTVEGCTLSECAFEIHFLRSFDDVDATGSIVLTYYLHLDTEGDTYDEDYEQIENSAQVTFGTTSASPEVTAETYTFGFEIFKYTGEYIEGTSQTNTYYVLTDTLEHDGPAEIDNDFFLVATDGENNYYGVFNQIDMDEEGNFYLLTGWVDNEDDATSITEPDDGVELPVTIYVSPENMEVLAGYFNETSVDALLENVRFHMLEEGGNADEQQDDDDAVSVVTQTVDIPGTNGTPLANAEFEVTREVTETADDGTTTTSTQTAYFLYESELNIYLLEGWLEEGGEVPSGYTTTITSGSDGMIYVEGFDTGTYTVTEIKAPDGYNLLTSSITVTISAEYDGDTGLMTNHTVSWSYGDSEGTGVVNVENNAGTILPGTGGMGTTIFYIVGAILICGAAVVLITRRRMNHAA